MSDREVVYEVSLQVERAIASEYLEWLRTHVAQMIALPGFLGADVYAIDADVATADVAGEQHVGWCVQYRLRDRDALDMYLSEHAPRIREQGLARFGMRFRAQRRILHPLGPG